MIPLTYTGGSVSTNGYLLETPEGLIVVDAPEGMAEQVRATGLTPLALLLTHHHFDHVEDAAELAQMGASIHAFAPMSPDLTLAEEAARWGLPITIEPYTVDRILEGEQTLDLAGQTFDLLHVPGHSPDSLVFHLAKQAIAFAGDTLFAQSIGRTDLPGGRNRQLLNAIRSQLFPLPAATRVLPGHGPETTIQQEVASNPYLQ
ncbi:MAG: MBL fold metallo-hydrolase [Akkermansiaceae bacterium]|nr:MBL fold metallo-hydrolase [Akkermansiaceae bacterium]